MIDWSVEPYAVYAIIEKCLEWFEKTTVEEIYAVVKQWRREHPLPKQ